MFADRILVLENGECKGSAAQRAHGQLEVYRDIFHRSSAA
jgi:hypothetical protein